ncbi:MAG: phosphodiester glycosidase family protein [Eubacterium sp.]|jgi:exopolysaccharide biosynthesis protein|nr:phosphodiester glycosidase family protein [Eubacterium sp.]
MTSAKKNRTKKRLLIVLTIFFLITVAAILYKLADRYLIEHVQVANAMENVTQSTNKSTQQISPATDENPYGTADDWNYTSDTKTIKIKKVTEGSGQDTITYYVADVSVKDSSELKSAFAKNEFGSNIVEYTSEIAGDSNAVFAVNGDYYGFRDDGIVIRNGKIFRDSPARTGLAFYSDGSMKIYDETTTTAERLLAEGVTQTLSFGPALVQNSTAITDFARTVIDTNFGNRSIQSSNPRTGIGIIAPNHYVFVVVDGRSPNYSRGMTLTEFAQVFEELGCTEAYNLDGGGSSTMYFMGRVVNNPLGKGTERGVSDIMYLGHD